MENEKVSLKASQSLETKLLIEKSALKLFNENGVDKVTTHDIAEAAGISPGNLYYHYRNKQAIIRALFYKIELFSVNKWNQQSPKHREVRFSDFMQFYFGGLSSYQFFFNDLSSILSNDPILAKEWRSAYERLFSTMQLTLDGWIQAGLIKPFRSRKEADVFIETIWILASFTGVHFKARFAGKKFSPKESAKYLATFLYPYHTAKGQRVIDLYL